MTTDDLLKQGIAALRAGPKTEAHRLLTQVVQQDERNEMAWLWLSGAVDTNEDRRICLEKVLAANPDNKLAQRGLEALRKSSPSIEATPGIALREHAVTMQPTKETETDVRFQPTVAVSPDSELENTLQRAIAAIESGKKETGRELLVKVIEQDENNEIAWLWTTRCVADRDVKRDCFERVLSINPENKHAIEGLKRLELVSRVEKDDTDSKKRGVSNRNKLIIALSSAMVLIAVISVSVFAWQTVYSPIKEETDPNSPENVATRFLTGTFGPDDVAPDGTYESTYGFDQVWVSELERLSGEEFELELEFEIHDVIVRDSVRLNSKEVTIWYSTRTVEPDYWDATLEEWTVFIEFYENEGTAFFVLELLDDRWVVWCAETGRGSARFPDVCEY